MKRRIKIIASSERAQLIQFIQTSLTISYLKAEEIADRFTEKTFFKNDILLGEGKVCNEYFFLEHGFVRAYTYDINGNDITTNFYSNNQVVCELFSFFKRVHTRETFQALTDCNTWYITFDNLQVAFHSMPEFREFGRSMLVGAYAELKQRMLSMLHHTAEERYLNLVQSSPDIFQNAPLKNIASYLGVTSTSLSRIRKDLSKK
ncbi:MAG: Crp/Fnr family transcriptional regulator [Ferruginibacter sp.]